MKELHVPGVARKLLDRGFQDDPAYDGLNLTATDYDVFNLKVPVPSNGLLSEHSRTSDW